mmetsp:Transcript_39869/g.48574  ORF Transcript_39869/g.48574 Transcript_39869/m.48574 type:complete len:527 (-) Transcript_39869:76-1656(-)
MEAVWAMEPNSVSEETHTQFYKFIANAFDEPFLRLHFRADAPIDIKALFYVPSFHQEKMGMGRMEPGVSLYSRKVLIEAKSNDILPEWLRFVKGVVDSEDLPLSISREKPQDTALIRKLKKALTRKFISHLTTMAKKEPAKYKDEFYKEYGYFLKEGICQDHEFQESLAKLLYFETSKTMAGEITSLEEYIARMEPGQDTIYYLCAPNRKLASDSPYMEAFDKHNKEVLFLFSAMDDFVMNNLVTFENRKLVSCEKSDISFDKKDEDNDDDKDKSSTSTLPPLSNDQAEELCHWFQEAFSNRIKKCKTTTRLQSSPAFVTDHESSALRNMMRMVATEDGHSDHPVQKQTLEINPSHDIITGIYYLKDREPKLAKTCAEQVIDNCLVAAGILDDGRTMLPRLNDLLMCVLKGAKALDDVTGTTTTPAKDGHREAVITGDNDSEENTQNIGDVMTDEETDEMLRDMMQKKMENKDWEPSMDKDQNIHPDELIEKIKQDIVDGGHQVDPQELFENLKKTQTPSDQQESK